MELVAGDGSLVELGASDLDGAARGAACLGSARDDRDRHGACGAGLRAAPGRPPGAARGRARDLDEPIARNATSSSTLPARRRGALPETNNARGPAPRGSARPRKGLGSRTCWSNNHVVRRVRAWPVTRFPADPAASTGWSSALAGTTRRDRPLSYRVFASPAWSASPRWSTACRAATAPRRCGCVLEMIERRGYHVPFPIEMRFAFSPDGLPGGGARI